MQHGKPRLVCDFEELYRYLVDDFLLERSLKFHENDFMAKTDTRIKLRAYPKRLVLRENETNELVDNICSFFDTTVNVARIKVGYKSTINTVIDARVLSLAGNLFEMNFSSCAIGRFE